MAWDTDLKKDSTAYKIAAAAGPHVRVLAGPGTGKSFAMKRRVARLLEEKTPPKQILAVTFTRVAAEDLHRELQSLGTPGCDELEGQTLHSLGMRILSRKHVLEALQRIARPLNRFETSALLSDIADAHGGKRNCRKLIAAYEAAWAQSQGDEVGFPKTDAEKAFQKDLIDWLKFHESMLIGEIIPYLVRYLRGNPHAAEHTEFKHVLVDEYQDLNKAEQTAIEYLATKSNICVVCDDDQSIYSFKNAHPEGIREWPKTHPGCTDLAMDECHRCPVTIVEMANSLISNNANRDDRQLKPIPSNGKGEVEIVQAIDPAEEASWIANRVSQLIKQGVHESEIIVLIQRAKMARAILEALKQAGVKAKSYYEESQLETEIAQEKFALFKLLLDNEDRAALRFLLGKGSPDWRRGAYKRLRSYCEEHGQSPWTVLERLASGELNIPYTKPLVNEFKQLSEQLNSLSDLEGDLSAIVDVLFPDSVEPLSALRELALALLDECEDASELFSGMMKEITQPDIPPTVEEVRVMSLHKSKGLSSPYVFIASCLQGVLPQIAPMGTPKEIAEAALEESRRLLFVGITRVKANPSKKRPGSLFISYPREMNAGEASGASVAFEHIAYGQAQLLPSEFIEQLGPSAPRPKKAQ